MTKKSKTIEAERGYFKIWIEPVIGGKPFKSISPLDIERIKSDMLKAGRAVLIAHSHTARALLLLLHPKLRSTAAEKEIIMSLKSRVQ